MMPMMPTYKNIGIKLNRSKHGGIRLLMPLMPIISARVLNIDIIEVLDARTLYTHTRKEFSGSTASRHQSWNGVMECRNPIWRKS